MQRVADPSPSDRNRQDTALFARYLVDGDRRAREELVERFMPLARQLARRYHRAEEPFDDLLQVASLGLLKAIDRFDLDRGIAFSSYAVPTILGELKRHFRDRTWSVRVPRDLQELVLKVDGTVSDLGRELHRAPTVAEISQRLSVSEEDILEAMQAGGAYRATSLETPRGDEEGDTLADSLGTDEDGFAQAEHRATLDRLLSRGRPARARGAAAALPGGPDAGRDRRAHRRLADAGQQAHPPGGRPPARDGGGGRAPAPRSGT